MPFLIGGDRRYTSKFHWRGTKVLYLAMEEDESQLKEQFEQLGLHPTPETDTNLRIKCGIPSEGADLAALSSDMESFKPNLVVIDTIFRLIPVKDGNAYNEVSSKLSALLILSRNLGCHVMAVHHANKGVENGAESVLGSTALIGTVDTNIILGGDKPRTIVTSQRYGRSIEKTNLEFDEQRRIFTLGATTDEEKEVGFETKITEEKQKACLGPFALINEEIGSWSLKTRDGDHAGLKKRG